MTLFDNLRLFQAAVRMLAIVPLLTGGLGWLLGSSFVLDAGPVSPSVESEIRFMAIWWASVGVLLLAIAPRITEAGPTALFRGINAVLFLAGAGRVMAMASHGQPHPMFASLAVVELLIPVPALLWHRQVTRANTSSPTFHARSVSPRT